ncbi:MAG: site-specific integrase [Bacteroidota bacterium]
MSVTTKFKIREDLKRKDKLCPVYLFITGDSKRERINLKILISAKNWDNRNQAIKPVDKVHQQANAVIDHLKGQIGFFKSQYMIDGKQITPALLAKEIFGMAERSNFIAFFKIELKEDRSLKKGTRRRYETIINKLEAFSDFIAFSEINERYLERFRNHLYKMGNNTNTVNSNMMAIKKYLRRAKKDGIKIPLDLDDVKVGAIVGNREALIPAEVKSIMNFYYDSPIDSTMNIVAGYFLFSCFAGLRISDVLKLRRCDIRSGQFSMVQTKTGKSQTLTLNKLASRVFEHNPHLFEKTFADSNINITLKELAKVCKIEKHLTFHVARHTFATNFLRSGGKVEHLQQLLGHSKIATTMLYVHLLSEESNAEMFKLDRLFE